MALTLSFNFGKTDIQYSSEKYFQYNLFFEYPPITFFSMQQAIMRQNENNHQSHELRFFLVLKN